MKIRITFKPLVNMPDKELEADSWYTEGGWVTFKRKGQEGKVAGAVGDPVAVYDMWAILGFEVIDKGNPTPPDGVVPTPWLQVMESLHRIIELGIPVSHQTPPSLEWRMVEMAKEAQAALDKLHGTTLADLSGEQ